MRRIMVAIVVVPIVVFLFLFLVPVFPVRESSHEVCGLPTGICTPYGYVYYQSLVHKFTPFGGQYLPPAFIFSPSTNPQSGGVWVPQGGLGGYGLTLWRYWIIWF
jgi:hypothetical protein